MFCVVAKIFGSIKNWFSAHNWLAFGGFVRHLAGLWVVWLVYGWFVGGLAALWVFSSFTANACIFLGIMSRHICLMLLKRSLKFNLKLVFKNWILDILANDGEFINYWVLDIKKNWKKSKTAKKEMLKIANFNHKKAKEMTISEL